MDTYTVRRLGLILAVQAEIEGMKALNELKKVYGDEPPYSFDHFNDKAEELRNLAASHDEQL